MPKTSSSFAQWQETVRSIADQVVGPAARSVDKDARFPKESFDALKKARLLALAAPTSVGGGGASMHELSVLCELLGERCASTAMVFAMHHIQVACLARHGGSSRFIKRYLEEVAARQLLIASVTSEAGVGGNTRVSVAPIQRRPDGTCSLRKDGTVVSYGDDADDFLVTVRRSPESPASDQALVLVKRDGCQLERTGDWDTMGMRGTCSPGYVVTATFAEDQIVPAPFADISAQTMVPYAHILWSSCWLGIASDAVARARAFVRDVARQMPGTTPPQALRLSEVTSQLQLMRLQVESLAETFDELTARPDEGRGELSSMGFALRMNHLKITSSRLAVDIVTQALRICGTAGYRNDTKFSVARHLRDAHSAALMIGNDRIHAGSSNMLLVTKE